MRQVPGCARRNADLAGDVLRREDLDVGQLGDLLVEVQGGPANRTVTLSANGVAFASLALDGSGRGKLELATDKGDSVPALAPGATLEVRAGAGALVASGTMQ